MKFRIPYFKENSAVPFRIFNVGFRILTSEYAMAFRMRQKLFTMRTKIRPEAPRGDVPCRGCTDSHLQ